MLLFTYFAKIDCFLLLLFLLRFRNALKQNYNQGNYYVDVNLMDLAAFDEALAEKVYKEPTEYLPVFEEAAKRVADEVTTPRPENETDVHDIQVLLSSEGHSTSLRCVKVLFYNSYYLIFSNFYFLFHTYL